MDDSAVPLVSPRAQSFADTDDTVSRLEEHIAQQDDVFGDHQEHAPIQRPDTTFSESSYYSRSSPSRAMDTGSSRLPRWSRYDASSAPRSNSVAPYPSQSEQQETKWQRMRLIPKQSLADPFSDPSSTPIVYGAAPATPLDYTFPSNAIPPSVSPVNEHPSRPVSSAPYSSHDYDPEAHAIDSTPDKLYSHQHDRFPPSRSPTPEPSPTPPPTRRAIPSTLPSGLTRRVLSSKENTPLRSFPPKVEAERSPQKQAPVPETSPMVESATMHFGLPPKKQRRRHQGARKLVPLTQYVENSGRSGFILTVTYSGNFVVELDVPSNMVMPERNLKEALTVRYAIYGRTLFSMFHP